MTTAADFWAELESQEIQRKAREQRTREMRARPQYRVASNDEPEPVLRQPLRAAALNQVERELAAGFAGPAFPLKGRP